MTQISPDTRAVPEGTAFFAGSFNPFTVGHASLVERALALFGRVVIAVGVNMAKSGSPDGRLEPIRRLYSGCPRVEVVSYSGLTVDAAAAHGATCLLRGVRSVRDFEYERDLADVNRQLSGIETVILYSLPEFAAVSSSTVRELMKYGRDVSAFLPHTPFTPTRS